MGKILMASTLAVVCILFSGCASIVDGGYKTIHIDSCPAGASFVVYDSNEKRVGSGTTPAEAGLKRYHGYFQGEDYKLVFECPGYYSGETFIKHTVDGWYFGNIIFGGLIGLVIVDPLTGSMWTLSPREITYNLVSTNLNLGPAELKEAQQKANPAEPAKTTETKKAATHPKAGYR
jgi:hypothetical protein